MHINLTNNHEKFDMAFFARKRIFCLGMFVLPHPACMVIFQTKEKGWLLVMLEMISRKAEACMHQSQWMLLFR